MHEIQKQLRSTTEHMVGTAEKMRALRVLEVRRSANRQVCWLVGEVAAPRVSPPGAESKDARE